MKFPQYVSFTITNSCNLRCQMCGQWSETGYIKNQKKNSDSYLELADWKMLVDEISSYNTALILVRGGEPFLYPGIIELLEYISNKGIALSVDTNGTIIDKYAARLVKIKNMHITFSVDGPEEIHDMVRGAKGSFKKIKRNIALIHELEKNNKEKISKSICFTISKYSYKGLGEMPDVARSMSIDTINIVPYYYFTPEVGMQYEAELKNHFNCQAFSWKGFQHKDSGIDIDIFKEEYKKYIANLKGIHNFPFMPLVEEDYINWFKNPSSVVGFEACHNTEKLIDIQPNGEANFCVDFPDYCIGNVKESSLKEIWESPEAEKFRSYRQKKPLAICYRCGAKYIAELEA